MPSQQAGLWGVCGQRQQLMKQAGHQGEQTEPTGAGSGDGVPVPGMTAERAGPGVWATLHPWTAADLVTSPWDWQHPHFVDRGTKS